MSQKIRFHQKTFFFYKFLPKKHIFTKNMFPSKKCFHKKNMFSSNNTFSQKKTCFHQKKCFFIKFVFKIAKKKYNSPQKSTMIQKGSKLVKNYPNGSKRLQYGPIWSKWVQIFPHIQKISKDNNKDLVGHCIVSA